MRNVFDRVKKLGVKNCLLIAKKRIGDRRNSVSDFLYPSFGDIDRLGGKRAFAPAGASEQYMFLKPNDLYMSPLAWHFFHEKAEETGADMVYSDSRTAEGFCYRPDFGEETLSSGDYLGEVLYVRKELVEHIRESMPARVQEQMIRNITMGVETDMDAVLRNCIVEELRQNPEKYIVSHVPHVLYESREEGALFWREEPAAASTQDIARVSILIPNKDSVDLLSALLDSIVEKSGNVSYEILILENNSILQETFEFYKEIEGEKYPGTSIRVVDCSMPWNYSAINNMGVKEAKGEYLLFLNNDMKVVSDHWLESLLAHAGKPGVGAVGAKLLFPDDTIQHAGVIVGCRGVAGHAMYGMPDSETSYFAWKDRCRNVSAVTGACLMVKKERFLEVGGFEERLGVAFNDVDLCLRLLYAGYRNVYEPATVLYHYESKSRGRDDSPEKKKRFGREIDFFRRRHMEFILQGDPCYNSNLDSERDDYTPVKGSLVQAGCQAQTASRMQVGTDAGGVDVSREKEHEDASSVINSVTVSLVLPVKNGGKKLKQCMEAIQCQTLPYKLEIVAVDSGSTDGSLEYLQGLSDVRVLSIPPQEFGHGKTRNFGISQTHGKYVFLLTQDAVLLGEHSLWNMIRALEQNPSAAGAFGKHVPYSGCNLPDQQMLEDHFAQWGPGNELFVLNDENRSRYENDLSFRMKTGFYSDNFSCLRRQVWEKLPYPEVDYAEDQLWGDAILRAGYGKLYVSDAVVMHSHNYSLKEYKLRRYDDLKSQVQIYGPEFLQSLESSSPIRRALGDTKYQWGYILHRPDLSMGAKLHWMAYAVMRNRDFCKALKSVVKYYRLSEDKRTKLDEKFSLDYRKQKL